MEDLSRFFVSDLKQIVDEVCENFLNQDPKTTFRRIWSPIKFANWFTENPTYFDCRGGFCETDEHLRERISKLSHEGENMEVREINLGSKKHTRVFSIDDHEFGANHHYQITDVSGGSVLNEVKFQKGPVKEHGVNGVHNEDLIAIVIDRLECFNKTDFKCRENSLAITKLEEALHWLRHRTENRESRGVEGTHTI